jgi:uncharacterized protein YggE
MRTRPVFVVLAVLLAFLLAAAGTALALGPADGSVGNRTISVAGTGQVDVAPDAAEVRLSVTASAADAASASQAVADDAESLRSALADFGVDDANVRSVGYDVHGERGPREEGDAERYRARQTFVVTLDDVDRAGALIDAAVAGGADEVHGVSFTLSEDARAEARDEALRAALENARGDADVLADAAALDIDGVQAMSTTGTDVRPFHAEAMAVTADGASTDIDSRDVTVSATVEVVFGARAD